MSSKSFSVDLTSKNFSADLATNEGRRKSVLPREKVRWVKGFRSTLLFSCLYFILFNIHYFTICYLPLLSLTDISLRCRGRCATTQSSPSPALEFAVAFRWSSSGSLSVRIWQGRTSIARYGSNSPCSAARWFLPWKRTNFNSLIITAHQSVIVLTAC